MSKHRSPHHRENFAVQRRDQFIEGPSRRAPSPTALVLGACLVLAGVLAYVVASSQASAGRDGTVTEIQGAGVDVALPVEIFADGAARFYRYTTGSGRSIRFFVMRSSDGVIRAAFDACDTCYRDRLGYVQQGDVMVCRKCGRSFPSVDINVVQGGCNPAPIERIVKGDSVLLTANALEAGAFYF